MRYPRGIVYHVTPTLAADLADIKAAGYGLVRVDAALGDIFLANGTEQWGRLDAVVAACEAAGLALAIVLNYGLKSNGPTTKEAVRTPEARTSWAAAATRTALRYQGRTAVVAYELWNEPDHESGSFWLPGTNAGEFLLLVKDACRMVRQFVPGVVLWGPASVGDLAFLEALMRGGAFVPGTTLDFVSFHPYGRGPDPFGDLVDRAAAVRALRDRLAPNAGLVASEWGPMPSWLRPLVWGDGKNLVLGSSLAREPWRVWQANDSAQARRTPCADAFGGENGLRIEATNGSPFVSVYQKTATALPAGRRTLTAWVRSTSPAGDGLARLSSGLSVGRFEAIGQGWRRIAYTTDAECPAGVAMASVENHGGTALEVCGLCLERGIAEADYRAAQLADFMRYRAAMPEAASRWGLDGSVEYCYNDPADGRAKGEAFGLVDAGTSLAALAATSAAVA